MQLIVWMVLGWLPTAAAVDCAGAPEFDSSMELAHAAFDRLDAVQFTTHVDAARFAAVCATEPLTLEQARQLFVGMAFVEWSSARLSGSDEVNTAFCAVRQIDADAGLTGWVEPDSMHGQAYRDTVCAEALPVETSRMDLLVDGLPANLTGFPVGRPYLLQKVVDGTVVSAEILAPDARLPQWAESEPTGRRDAARKRSVALPVALASAGFAALVTGAYLTIGSASVVKTYQPLQTADERDATRAQYGPYHGVGVGLLVGGTAVIGAGGVLAFAPKADVADARHRAQMASDVDFHPTPDRLGVLLDR